MFLRKLLVIILPLALVALFALLMPLLATLGLFREIICGLMIGLMLALVLPLSGATKRREYFGSLLWAPALLLLVLIVLQYLVQTGSIHTGVITLLAVKDGRQMEAECAMLAFLATEYIRTR